MTKTITAKSAAATLLGAAAFLAASATAQAAPQIIGQLYQEIAVAQCSNQYTNCTVEFTQIPPDMGLLVQQIDCRATVPNTVELYNIALMSFTANAISGKSYLVPTLGKAATTANRVYSISQAVDNVFLGSKPIVNVYSTVAAKYAIACVISGVRKYASQW